MASVVGKISNSNAVATRSSSVDSAIFDGDEDSPDEIFDDEEECFDEFNEDNQQNGQCKLVIFYCFILQNKFYNFFIEYLYHV
jgi:hypothetical protein